MATTDLSCRVRPRHAGLPVRTRAGAAASAAARIAAPTAGCDAAARSRRTAITISATPGPQTDAWLAEHRLDPLLAPAPELGDEQLRGTAGRGQLSVEAGRTASALDGSSALDGASAQVPFPELPSDQPSLVAIGGSATMRLQTLNHLQQATSDPGAAPSAHSMRVMETGLAFVAIVVALLLNLGR